MGFQIGDDLRIIKYSYTGLHLAFVSDAFEHWTLTVRQSLVITEVDCGDGGNARAG